MALSASAPERPYAPGLIDYRPVLFILGILLMTLALAMCIPAVADATLQDLDWQVFLASAGITFFAGASLALTNRPSGTMSLSLREAFLLTCLTWTVITAFAALPFTFSTLNISFTDAYFEAMSGLTTTGSTILTGLDHTSVGILLWRSILQAMGGIGIIVLAVAILPFLRIGGMQLFRTESSDRSDKAMPRISQFALSLFTIYVILLVLCAIALWLTGMSFFEAVTHSMTAISTGGFSTRDASIAGFDSPAIEIVLIVFMALGGATFTLYVRAWHGDPRALLKDPQIRLYFTVIAIASLGLAAWQILVNDTAPFTAVRAALFNVVSVVTTTGYASADYNLWGTFPVAMFFVLTFLGGCTGSTAGGIKIFRVYVLLAVARLQVRRLLHPRGVFVPVYGSRPLPDAVVHSVMGFVFLYLLSFVALGFGLTFLGLDPMTAFSGSITAISNVGPGLGDIIGPAGNFAPLPAAAKWLLSFGMLLGRLELMTIFVLLTPAFWRG